MKINVINHASIKLEDTATIYIDPYQITQELKDANYIFITHNHYDHYDEESIFKVLNHGTIIIIPKELEQKAKSITNKVISVEPDKTYKINDIIFDTIKSYNIDKIYHPKENMNVGYKILIKGTSYYIMGDTDRTEETNNVKADVCFVPIGGKFTMDVNEAIDYINYVKPKKAIPIHYGSIVGDKSLGEEFKNRINKEIEVEIFI